MTEAQEFPGGEMEFAALPDHLLASLVEHFPKIPLGVRSVSQDDLGEAYEEPEFLKKLVIPRF